MERLKSAEYYPFDKLTCQKVVRKVFNRAEVDNVQMLAGGVVNANLEISLRNPQMQLHLKVYGGEDAEIRANKERAIYDLIAKQTNVPVPKIYLLDTSKTMVSNVVALQSSLPGVNLETVCDKLTVDEQEKIAFKMGECLGQLHTIRFDKFCEKFSEGIIDDELSWNRFFLDFVERNISWCEKHGTLASNLANAIREHILEWQELLPEDQPLVLIHKDFHSGNIKVQKNQKDNWRISGIYDFEHAIFGHNEFDFAKPHWAFFEPYPQMKEPMLLGYNSVNKLSPLFELRMDKLYRLGEITDFLVFGATQNMDSEIARNILSVKEILRRTV